MKNYETVVTQGMIMLLEKTNLNLFPFINTAISLHEKNNENYFISFKQVKDNVVITDGNENILFQVKNNIPSNFWVIVDDYDDKFIVTCLLPSEY